MNPNYTILVVEDEESDFYLLERAFRKNGITNPIQWMKDGMEAIHYLEGMGQYAQRDKFPFPEVILLDLKIPRMSGLEVLAWIRDHRQFRVVPTIVMSSSQQDVDIEAAYSLGANTYFVKPTDFQSLVGLTQSIHDYWLKGTKPGISRRPK